jgi:hypothetical protein
VEPLTIRDRILAHRGLWANPADANSYPALTRALEAGFGIETDLRDFAGRVVISHDPPGPAAPEFSTLLRLWADLGLEQPRLALNVKSDGLLSLLTPSASWLVHRRHFFFDMSFPQLLSYVRDKRPVALRVSEFEPAPLELIRQLSIDRLFWLDGFESDWWLHDPVIDAACTNSHVWVVSPEIHGRDPERVWAWFKAMVEKGHDVHICTDRPFDVVEVCT